MECDSVPMFRWCRVHPMPLVIGFCFDGHEVGFAFGVARLTLKKRQQEHGPIWPLPVLLVLGWVARPSTRLGTRPWWSLVACVLQLNHAQLWYELMAVGGGGGNFMESSSFGLQIMWETLRKTSRYRYPVFFCFSCESWCPRHERFGSTMATTMFGRENGNMSHSLTYRLLQLCMGTLQHLGKMHLEGEKLQNETGKNAPLKGDMKDKSRWHTAHDGVWYAFFNVFFQCIVFCLTVFLFGYVWTCIDMCLSSRTIPYRL